MPPGFKLLKLDFTLNRNAVESSIDGALLPIDMTQIHALRAARLHVYVAEYNGEQSFYDFALSSEQVFTLLKGHTERCNGLGKDAYHRKTAVADGRTFSAKMTGWQQLCLDHMARANWLDLSQGTQDYQSNRDGPVACQRSSGLGQAG